MTGGTTVGVEVLDDRVVIDGTTINHRPMAGPVEPGDQVLRDPIIFKGPDLLRIYLDLLSQVAGGNIVELGIYLGGSAVVGALAARPRRLVAIDICDPVPGLLSFIDTHGLHDVVRPHFGVDQADRERLEQILDDEIGDQPIDLVVDDASHLLEPTRSSFSVLFRRLRPGARFAIEDWSHGMSHRTEMRRLLADDMDEARDRLAVVADPGHRHHGLAKSMLTREMAKPSVSPRLVELVEEVGFPLGDEGLEPLSDILEQLAAQAVSDRDVVASVEVRPDVLIIERGPAELPPGWTLPS